ncbi:hypothetical protein Patl1_36553 [Pistacia atlantica]|nr:hypothetical protein Patl1_36553 [Pistacia atlantica]
MDAEEEDASKSSNFSTRFEDDSVNKTSTVAAVTDSHEEVQRETEPQCHSESVAELSEAHETASVQLSLGEGKEEADDSVQIERESIESQTFASAVAGEANQDEMNGGDLAVSTPLVGGGGNDEDVICEEGNQAEETEDKADDLIKEKEIRADVVEEKEGRLDMAEEMGIKADVAEETEVRADVAEETRNAADVAEQTVIKADVAEQAVIKADVIEETEIKADVTELTEIKVDMAEETEIKTEVAEVMEDRAAMLKEMEIADETKDEVTRGTEEVAQMAEETAIENEKKDLDVTEETDDREGVLETLEVDAEVKTEEMDTAGLAKETAAVEETAVAKTAGAIEFGDVADETEVLEENIGMADVAGGETVLAEETEMRKGAEMEEVDTEMGDMAEEADADIADEMETADVTEEIETGEELEEVGKTVGGKRKRGKNSRPIGRAPSRKKSEEDVCFICFDGGELVLCDRRGCPKAYHPSCVNRDEAFFRAKGRWNCGVIYSTANLAVVDLCEGTGSKIFSFAQHNVQVLQAHQVGLLCVI